MVATAGTTNTGAIDPLDEIADVCTRHGLWLHVDGAYGAPPVLLLDGFEAARDGLALYAPVDAGLVLIRDGGAARDTFSLVPPYLRTAGTRTGRAARCGSPSTGSSRPARSGH